MSEMEMRAEGGSNVSVCTAHHLVIAILERHRDDYAGGKGLAIASELVAWPGELRRRPVRQWFVEVRSMLSESVDVVHGRAFILGLSLLDRLAGRAVVAGGLFAAIAVEIEEGIDGILSARGKERILSIPLASVGARGPAATLEDRTRCAAALSPDGRRALTSSQRQLVVWSVGTQMRRDISTHHQVWAARFGDSGRSIVAVLDDGSIYHWSTGSSDSQGEDFGPRVADGAALSRDAATVVYRTDEPELAVWDRSSRVVTSIGLGEPALRVAVSVRGEMVVAYTRSGFEVFERSDGGYQQSAAIGWDEDVVSFDCANGQLLAATKDRLVIVFGLGGGFEAPVERPRRIALGPDGHLVAASHARGVTLRHGISLVALAELTGAAGSDRMTFSGDGRRLITTVPRVGAQVWDVGVDPPAAPPPPATYVGIGTMQPRTSWGGSGMWTCSHP